ncbi:hypothetical protein [Erwinia mallotivora]|uniref:hypothetical protein n=1 Tax=Erwinia mallotivora TaxID=69222 RepID=UPI0027DF8DD1|nr:hypothetical protein [Erwinia mallotivora]
MDKIKNIREKSKTVHRYEASKSFPDRYPYNADSIGYRHPDVGRKNLTEASTATW